jgi:hypothetical protein
MAELKSQEYVVTVLDDGILPPAESSYNGILPPAEGSSWQS